MRAHTWHATPRTHTHPEAVARAVDRPGVVFKVGRNELDGLERRVADGAEGAPEARVDHALV